MLWHCILDSNGFAWGPLDSCYEHGEERSGSTKMGNLLPSLSTNFSEICKVMESIPFHKGHLKFFLQHGLRNTGFCIWHNHVASSELGLTGRWFCCCQPRCALNLQTKQGQQSWQNFLTAVFVSEFSIHAVRSWSTGLWNESLTNVRPHSHSYNAPKPSRIQMSEHFSSTVTSCVHRTLQTVYL
jgi:hypothetical protein